MLEVKRLETLRPNNFQKLGSTYTGYRYSKLVIVIYMLEGDWP
jgi:hypothetical protein